MIIGRTDTTAAKDTPQISRARPFSWKASPPGSHPHRWEPGGLSIICCDISASLCFLLCTIPTMFWRRFQISDFRFQVSGFLRGPASRPSPRGRIIFQISDLKGLSADFYHGQISDFRSSSRVGTAQAKALQTLNFRFPAPPDPTGPKSIRSRMQISDFKLQRPL